MAASSTSERQDLLATFFACCLCSPDCNLDNFSSVFFNLACPIHGHTWHRKMIRLADGSVTLVHKLANPWMDPELISRLMHA